VHLTAEVVDWCLLRCPHVAHLEHGLLNASSRPSLLPPSRPPSQALTKAGILDVPDWTIAGEVSQKQTGIDNSECAWDRQGPGPCRRQVACGAYVAWACAHCLCWLAAAVFLGLCCACLSTTLHAPQSPALTLPAPPTPPAVPRPCRPQMPC
jgi:hypothetical protein